MYYLLAVFSLLSCSMAYGQSPTYNQGGATVKNYYTVLSYENINGKIIVPVELGGKKHRFLFDTGAPTALSKELAAEIKAGILFRNLITDVNGNTDSVTAVKIDSIKLGEVSFYNVPAMKLIPEFYHCLNVDGVVGSNMLRNTIVSIQSDKKQIVLTDMPQKLNLIKSNSIPLLANRDNQSNPFIKITLKNKADLLLGFDTGDNALLRFSEDFMNQLNKYQVFEIAAKGFGGNNIGVLGLQANTDKYLLKIHYLNIGNARFNNVFTTTNKGGIPGVGSKLLDYGNITLDFIKGKFYFDARSPVNDLDSKQWPFQPTVRGNKMVVGIVWEKSLNLVMPGEQIIAIDNQDYTTFNLCDLVVSNAILGDKLTATITLKDKQGRERKIQISKE